MTDSVDKNLHIEKSIAKELKSNHAPYHFLCKSHTVVALGQSNINVLANLQHALKFREALESLNSGVKSFLRVKKSVVLCAIKCILSFVSHDKSAVSTNQQAKLFIIFCVVKEKLNIFHSTKSVDLQNQVILGHRFLMLLPIFKWY